jgi:hypothetical protein
MINGSRMMALAALASIGAVRIVDEAGDPLVIVAQPDHPPPTTLSATLPPEPTAFDQERIDRAERKRARKQASVLRRSEQRVG